MVLLKDVARLGRKGDIKDVPSGHATNFLIPRGLAIPGTKATIVRRSNEIEKIATYKAEVAEQYVKQIKALADRVITIEAPANDQGHLFSGIKHTDIMNALKKEDFSLPESVIILPHPIKEVGEHEIPLHYEKVDGVCHVVIVKK